MIHDNSHNRPDDDDNEEDTILLHGVSIPETIAQPGPEKTVTETVPPLTLRAFDDGIPGRDYQPRLLRFGEAA